MTASQGEGWILRKVVFTGGGRGSQKHTFKEDVHAGALHLLSSARLELCQHCRSNPRQMDGLVGKAHNGKCTHRTISIRLTDSWIPTVQP